MTIKQFLSFFINSILKSYSQIFFSQNFIFAIIILAVTFITPYLGAMGLLAVILTNLIGYFFNFNKTHIEEGVYGFNALLLGLALGFEYKFNIAFIIVFLSAIVFLLFITSLLQQVFYKYKLPFLTLPFLITYWIVYLGVGSFELIELQEQYIYVANYKAEESEFFYYNFVHILDNVNIPLLLKSYLKTLSATFFQNSVLAGCLIAFALLLFSRIAFSLSLIGFVSAYYVFQLLGLDTSLLTDYLVGSNFIFFAIAIGCFFVLPNKWSYLSVLLLTPALCLLYIGFSKIFLVFQLKSFTLSFVVLTILFLAFLNSGYLYKYLQQVIYQYYSPEKTIYKHFSTTKRFKNSYLAKFQLPIWGLWKLSQGYNGKITHIGEWSYALDFVITDKFDKTYSNLATNLTDFYSFNKPVLAPLDGYIYDIVNYVEDNDIAKVNTVNNWGNTVIINHNNGLFSQLSHLKKDSIKVYIGEYVTKGTIIALCGNSGRSPEPHIHFQVQLSPIIGSKPLHYPIAYFVETDDSGQQKLRTYEVPQENKLVSNVEISNVLKEAFSLVPQQKILFTNIDDKIDNFEWEIKTDQYNRGYIYCRKTNSYLWYVNDGTMFYCYDFEGSTKSLLFYFYLASYKILFSQNPKLNVEDELPLLYFTNPLILFLHDFISPFALLMKANYKSKNFVREQNVIIQSSINSLLFDKNIKQQDFEIEIKDSRIHELKLYQNKQIKKTYKCDIY